MVVRDVHRDWKGSLSPKVSPMDTNYTVEVVGKRRKLDHQIKQEMRIERNPQPRPYCSWDSGFEFQEWL